MQNKILDYFKLLKKNGSLGSSYLFIGDNVEQVTEVLKLVNCKANDVFCDICWECSHVNVLNHPDLFIVEPEPNVIKIEKIREVMQFLSLKPFRAKSKMLLVKGAQNLSSEAANAFLKTLEEPPKNTFIAVCASRMEGLLPTIISRCRKIFLSAQRPEMAQDSYRMVKDFLGGSRLEFESRSQFAFFLFGLIVLLRDSLLVEKLKINNRLLAGNEYGIMLPPLSKDKTIVVLDSLLSMYARHATINENLALNLIRMRLEQ